MLFLLLYFVGKFKWKHVLINRYNPAKKYSYIVSVCVIGKFNIIFKLSVVINLLRHSHWNFVYPPTKTTLKQNILNKDIHLKHEPSQTVDH